MSRQAAKKGRAVLEGVGLHTETIDACFSNHPNDDDGAVQEGLTKWSSGHSHKPPTWEALLDAMEYAEIAENHVRGLKEKLGCWVCCYIREQCMASVCVCLLILVVVMCRCFGVACI